MKGDGLAVVDRRPVATAKFPKRRDIHPCARRHVLLGGLHVERVVAVRQALLKMKPCSTRSHTADKRRVERVSCLAHQASTRAWRIPDAFQLPALWWPIRCRRV